MCPRRRATLTRPDIDVTQTPAVISPTASVDLAMPRLNPANDEPVGFQYPWEFDVVTKPSRVHRLNVTATVSNPNILTTANESCVFRA